MTISYHNMGMMLESNKIAAPIIYRESIASIVVFKLSVISIGLSIFVKFKNRAIVEYSCWFILLVLIALVFRWNSYMDTMQVIHADLSSDYSEIKDMIEDFRNNYRDIVKPENSP